MTPDEMTALLKFLRKQAALIAPGVTSPEIVTQAEKIVAGLLDVERDMAATFYVVHLLKEQHRQKVLNHERSASTTRRVRFEDTLAPDDPYFARKAELTATRHAQLQGILDDYTASMRVQWTRELLASTFATPDGRLVAWGAATIEEHEARRDMLIRNAEGNIEAAARHAQAVDDLQAAGVSTLGDLAKVAA